VSGGADWRAESRCNSWGCLPGRWSIASRCRVRRKVTLAGGCPDPAGAVSSNSLVLFFDLNHIAYGGDVVVDQSAVANQAYPTSPNEVMLVGTGQVGGCYQFAGVEGTVVLEFTAFFEAAALSFGAWVRPHPGSGDAGFMGNLQAGSGSFNLGTTQGGTDLLAQVVRPEGVLEVSMAAGVDAGAWQHVMATYDGHQLKLFKNGALVAESAYLPVAAPVPGADPFINVFALGAPIYGADRCLVGLLDEPRVYTRALGSNEVAALYQQGLLPSSRVELEERLTGACPWVLERVWTGTDACGSALAATQRLEILDTTAPQLQGVPPDATLSCSVPLPPPAVVTAEAGCTLGGTGVVVQFQQSGTAECGGSIVRSWQVADACGNSVGATQVITFVPTAPFALQGVPPDQALPCGAPIPPAPVVVGQGGCATATAVRVYWPMDDQAATDRVEDVVGASPGVLHSSVITGDVTLVHSVSGRVGRALTLEGSNDWIESSQDIGITGRMPRTVACWFRSTNHARARYVFHPRQRRTGPRLRGLPAPIWLCPLGRGRQSGARFSRGDG
jgi:hypothetical protein